MKNQNKIFRLLLGVALIAELCFFLPDVKAQSNYKDEVIPESQLEKTLLGIVLTYDQYKKDCYKDSTLSHTYTPKWNSGCLRQGGNLAEGYSYVIDCKNSSHYSYIHKTPTFEGWIEWLRVQGKK